MGEPINPEAWKWYHRVVGARARAPLFGRVPLVFVVLKRTKRNTHTFVGFSRVAESQSRRRWPVCDCGHLLADRDGQPPHHASGGCDDLQARPGSAGRRCRSMSVFPDCWAAGLRLRLFALLRSGAGNSGRERQGAGGILGRAQRVVIRTVWL